MVATETWTSRWESRGKKKKNLGNTDTVTTNRRKLRRNLGDAKTGFENTKVDRQQKEIICFLCSFGHMESNGLREIASGKFWLVTRRTFLMERKA